MCPICKQPVPSEIHRHKSLGIFVPVWRAGPCQNPECTEYAPRSGPPGTGPAPPDQKPRAAQPAARRAVRRSFAAGHSSASSEK